jgi:ATP-dependent RNA helicase DeaD
VSDDAVEGFAALGLRHELLDALIELGYEEPTPVQRETIPHLIDGRDLVGQAATGTGKTAAFALPLLHSLEFGGGRPSATALVVVPTRELAMQVSEAIFKYGRRLGVKVVPVYGGQPIFRQLQSLERGVHVVVGTPGRILDHLGRRSLDLDGIRTVVLDEADEMLDMGFADDIERILGSLPTDRQTVLFSATMPPRITGIAKRFLRDPVRITVGHTAGPDRPALITQRAFVVQRAHKPAALGRVLDIESPEAAIVFCRTRTEVDLLTETMNGRGYRAEALHGGMDQAQRDRVMGRLRDGTAELLIATDVAARGLDVDTLTHVVNYDVPSAPDSYVHRIGRVGRAGREGVAITLAEPRERRLLDNIEKATRQRIAIEPVPSVAELRLSRRRRRYARPSRPRISTTTASCSARWARTAICARSPSPRSSSSTRPAGRRPRSRRSPPPNARRRRGSAGPIEVWGASAAPVSSDHAGVTRPGSCRSASAEGRESARPTSSARSPTRPG